MISFRNGGVFLESLDFSLREGPIDTYLSIAAKKLLDSDVPVVFLAERVYGLGAIATRSSESDLSSMSKANQWITH